VGQRSRFRRDWLPAEPFPQRDEAWEGPVDDELEAIAKKVHEEVSPSFEKTSLASPPLATQAPNSTTPRQNEDVDSEGLLDKIMKRLDSIKGQIEQVRNGEDTNSDKTTQSPQSSTQDPSSTSQHPATGSVTTTQSPKSSTSKPSSDRPPSASRDRAAGSATTTQSPQSSTQDPSSTSQHPATGSVTTTQSPKSSTSKPWSDIPPSTPTADKDVTNSVNSKQVAGHIVEETTEMKKLFDVMKECLDRIMGEVEEIVPGIGPANDIKNVLPDSPLPSADDAKNILPDSPLPSADDVKKMLPDSPLPSADDVKRTLPGRYGEIEKVIHSNDPKNNSTTATSPLEESKKGVDGGKSWVELEELLRRIRDEIGDWMPHS